MIAKKKLKEVFENNFDRNPNLRKVWDTNKAFIRGYLIQQILNLRRDKRKYKIFWMK